MARRYKDSCPAIYKITSPTGRIYIGQTHDWRRRHADYKGTKCTSQRLISASINKYGFDNHIFEIEILLQLDISQGLLNWWEQFFYQHYQDNGYELMNLKFPGSKGKVSEETRKLLSIRSTGRKHTEEAKRKISNSKRGIPMSEEQKIRLSTLRIGKKHSEEHKLKIGRKGSLSASAKPIQQFTLYGELIRDWDCAADVNRELGYSKACLCRVLKGTRKQAYNFIWKYKTDN